MNMVEQLKQIQEKFDKLEEQRDKRVFIYYGTFKEFEQELRANGVKIEKNVTSFCSLVGLECIELLPIRCVLIGDRRDIAKILTGIHSFNSDAERR